MFTILNQKNVNQNNIEIQSYPNKNDCHQENKQLSMRMWGVGVVKGNGWWECKFKLLVKPL